MSVGERSIVEKLLGGRFGRTKEGLIEQVLNEERPQDRSVI
jgi:hypothetical protein